MIRRVLPLLLWFEDDIGVPGGVSVIPVEFVILCSPILIVPRVLTSSLVLPTAFARLDRSLVESSLQPGVCND